LKNYSLSKKIPYEDLLFSFINNNENTNKKNNILRFRNKFSVTKSPTESNNNFLNESNKFSIINDCIIINKSKVYNILNENNESYIFFFTDKLYNNSIIKLYSYLIEIDYEKLNPKLKWKYYLDFKQMKLLNEITKYENLHSFLPKIIKTDFQNGFLSIDFSIFSEFDIEILGYEKKNVINTNTIKNKNNNTIINISSNKDLKIEIQYPYIKVKKLINNGGNISFIVNKVDLDIDFLHKINNYKIDIWSKKILKILSDDTALSRNLNLSPKLSGTNVTERSNKINNTHLVPESKSSLFNRKRFLKSMSLNAVSFKNKLH
jgi:hypothetical protein